MGRQIRPDAKMALLGYASRRISEIGAPSNLIFLLESRLPYPDIGSWIFLSGKDQNGLGYYQSHNSGINFLYTDIHAKKLKLAATCTGKMWTDDYPDGSDSCQHLDRLPEEYR